jgi:hypothetical protein
VLFKYDIVDGYQVVEERSLHVMEQTVISLSFREPTESDVRWMIPVHANQKWSPEWQQKVFAALENIDSVLLSVVDEDGAVLTHRIWRGLIQKTWS